ncbi:MAG: hypothetical protein HY904_00380 [Deltaproteobacteria bacterium]|nr:hypothetical protein [Deltaproteobacteria bacterium]
MNGARPGLAARLLAGAACGGGTAEPCAFWQPPAWHGRLDDDALSELSGLALSRRNPGILWAVQDSGHTPTLFAVDLGAHVTARLELAATNTDWEAVSVGPCPAGTCVYVADIGDNAAARDHVTLWVLPEPEAAAPRAALPVEEVRLQYPDGAQDAEALVVSREGVPLILTKRTDGMARLYAAPGWSAGVTTVMEARGTLDVSRGPSRGLPASVTDASLFPDNTRLLVRTYLGAWEFLLPSGDVDDLVQATRGSVPFALEIQGEAVAYDAPRHGYWQAPEGAGAPLSFVGCRNGL